jgi:hypothetical protein
MDLLNDLFPHGDFFPVGHYINTATAGRGEELEERVFWCRLFIPAGNSGGQSREWKQLVELPLSGRGVPAGQNVRALFNPSETYSVYPDKIKSYPPVTWTPIRGIGSCPVLTH